MDTSKLTEAELDEFSGLLEKLGVLPKPKPKPRQKKSNTLEKYGLCAITTCDLCGSIYTHYILMYNESDYLRSITINKQVYQEQPKQKEEHFKQPTCPQCRTYLFALSKEVLVNMLLEKSHVNFR